MGADGGEAALAAWPPAAGAPEAAALAVLVYLQAQGLSAAQRKELAGAAFVPVSNGTRLVAPAQLFSRLQEDLSPFAYEVRLRDRL